MTATDEHNTPLETSQKSIQSEMEEAARALREVTS